MFKIFFTFLKLGLTSFGGPIAHLGFFHNEFVAEKKWISDQEYADLVALCQLLPGPASSQVGMAIGFYRGGVIGSVLAWLGFTLPSALIMIGFAISMNSLSQTLGNNWLHGLKIAAVAVVAQAVWEMAKKFCASYSKILVAIIAGVAALSFKGVWVQISLIVIGALVGALFFKTSNDLSHRSQEIKFNSKLSFLFLVMFTLLLLVLPLAASGFDSINLKLADTFYRVGALVFGGGHVVLPLLQSSMVDSGLMKKDIFIAGYGAAQAIPGPLFSFSAYLGFMTNQWGGAIISLIMIFLPSFFLVVGVLPHWQKIRSYNKMKSALTVVNAVVVGLLLAALYNPVSTSAILSWKDFVLALIAFLILLFKKAPSYAVVLGLALVVAVI